jgi:hypothetical protein
MSGEASPVARQFLRDEREPRIRRITALKSEIARCVEAGLYEAALIMQFIELDTWAYLMRPEEMTKHGRSSFKWFIDKYLKGDPAQEYQYGAEDAYAARCGIVHTLGSLSDLHSGDPSIVIWRFHLGKSNTYVPGTKGMAYISLRQFHRDASDAVKQCLADIMANDTVNALFSRRLPRVFFQAGVLPARDPDDIAALDPDIDAAIAILDGTVDSDEPIMLAGHTMVRGVCRG